MHDTQGYVTRFHPVKSSLQVITHVADHEVSIHNSPSSSNRSSDNASNSSINISIMPCNQWIDQLIIKTNEISNKAIDLSAELYPPFLEGDMEKIIISLSSSDSSSDSGNIDTNKSIDGGIIQIGKYFHALEKELFEFIQLLTSFSTSTVVTSQSKLRLTNCWFR